MTLNRLYEINPEPLTDEQVELIQELAKTGERTDVKRLMCKLIGHIRYLQAENEASK